MWAYVWVDYTIDVFENLCGISIVTDLLRKIKIKTAVWQSKNTEAFSTESSVNLNKTAEVF